MSNDIEMVASPTKAADNVNGYGLVARKGPFEIWVLKRREQIEGSRKRYVTTRFSVKHRDESGKVSEVEIPRSVSGSNFKKVVEFVKGL